jgi:hypothetical protein
VIKIFGAKIMFKHLTPAIFIFFCSVGLKLGNAQTAIPSNPNSGYVVILERSGYIDLSPFELSLDQLVELDRLRDEFEKTMQTIFAKEGDDAFYTWRRNQNELIEQKLRSILNPQQLDLFIHEENLSWLRSRANSPNRINHSGSILGVKEVHDILSLSTTQRDDIGELDKKSTLEIKKLREELAQKEDKMWRDYDERLAKILDREQRSAYNELIGDPVAVVDPFKAIGRLDGRGIYPRSPPSIINPPERTNQISQEKLDVLAKRLVFAKDLEDDLGLAPSQQQKWDKLKEDLTEAIKPHELNIVLQQLGVPAGFLDQIGKLTGGNSPSKDSEDPNRGLSSAQAQGLVLKACEEAFEVLLPKQQGWLRQVALQYYVASSGGKFPLRFDWVRSEVNVRLDQARQMDELLEEHDTKLNELVPEYVERDRKLRDEAEREFYNVLTPAQKKTLALYLGPPKREIDEKDQEVPKENIEDEKTSRSEIRLPLFARHSSWF